MKKHRGSGDGRRCSASSLWPPRPLPDPAGAGRRLLTDGDISDAYLYLLGRLLVVRQEILDFRDEGFKWNEVIYREPGGVAWANPNLDVAYSEAWVAVDENTPAVLDVPEIKGGRYYTWQMLNGWGETTVNINERSFSDHPFGKFAFVLQGSNPEIPADAVKVEVPNKKSRVLSAASSSGRTSRRPSGCRSSSR